jgi:lactoylglutathione lyase|tara:strand:+ start:584 stop:1027 length:444 start_codon:yes stop_codon:yes gene_type:complete
MNISNIDHIGIRITEKNAALDFYKILGFQLEQEVDFDAVIIMKNNSGVEINLINNGKDISDGKNILMDVPEKHPGFTHVAFSVESILHVMEVLEKNNIAISQGPVTFGRDGHVSIFIRDPDRNTIELRGRVEDESKIPGLTFYDPKG